jgi:hypothetical protein
MRRESRSVIPMQRIDPWSARRTPVECESDEFEDAQTFALLSTFRRAHGTSIRTTTRVHCCTAVDIFRPSTRGRTT